MREKIICIVTEDTEYGRTLGEYMINSHIVNYAVQVFSETEIYREYSCGNRVTLLLCDEESDILIPEGEEDCRLVLTEKRTQEADHIFKYQSLEIIVKEVLFKLRGYEGACDSHNLKIFSVGGSRGGSGVTTFSVCLAKELGRMGPTLFISFDPFMRLPIDLEKEGDASELAYMLKILGMSWIKKAGNFIRHGREFDYIAGVCTYEDIAEFGKNELRDFFGGLSADGRYRYVVADLGILPSGSAVVMEKSEMLFWIGDSEGLNPGIGHIKTITIPVEKELAKGDFVCRDLEGSLTLRLAKEELKLLDEDSSSAVGAGIAKKTDGIDGIPETKRKRTEKEEDKPPVRKRMLRLAMNGCTEIRG